MTQSLTSVSVAPVSAQVFSPSQWASLAHRLVGQDIVLLPATEQALLDNAVVNAAESTHRKASGLALVQHWASLGFVLSKADTLRLCEHGMTTHTWLHKHITPGLRERLGGHVAMTPMYPNFPRQVMKMNEAELLFNAVLHYAGDLFNLRIVPSTIATPRRPMAEKDARERVLRLADLAGVRQALNQVVTMNTVWTPAQVELAKEALPLLLTWNLVGADTALPQRENQAHVIGAWLKGVGAGRITETAWPASRVSTTDVLRAAVAYSGGDPSLASTSEKVRFAKMKRSQRRILMQALDTAARDTTAPLEDLHAHRQGWLRLAEALHVGEWKAFPAARAAIDSLRNAPAPVGWRGHLDALLATPATTASVRKVTDLALSNPGYMARALRRVLRWGGDEHAKTLTQAFAAVASRVDTPVLLSVEASLRADVKDGLRERLMLPKGSPGGRYRVLNEGLDANLAKPAAKACKKALLARFSAMAPLGKVYVEEGLDGVIVPKGLRTASDSVGAVTRGSWLPVGGDAKIIRLFLWWKDTETGSVDVDLSAVGVNEAYCSTETCNYHALREQGMTHSGDLTSAPEGAAEFIDVRLDKLRPDTRYIVLAANVYRGPAFSGLPECFVGWQERSSGQKGDIMELRSVVDKFRVTAGTKGFLGAVFDVKERRLMWLDLPLKSKSGSSIIHEHQAINDAVEDFQLYAAGQPSVGRLVDLHIEARAGERVDSAKEADTVFCLTPKKAKEGQVVIAATQPQTVASALLPSASAAVSSTKTAPTQMVAQEEPAEWLAPKVGSPTSVRLKR